MSHSGYVLNNKQSLAFSQPNAFFPNAIASHQEVLILVLVFFPANLKLSDA
jgi:hypothetical protein